jgi:hypothetical protein
MSWAGVDFTLAEAAIFLLEEMPRDLCPVRDRQTTDLAATGAMIVSRQWGIVYGPPVRNISGKPDPKYSPHRSTG